MSYKTNRMFSDQFIPIIKSICGTHLLVEAPFFEDTDRVTDLIVLEFQAIRIACRIRRHEHLQAYGSEFTIRENRTNGMSELSKILQGWGRYLFYGFSNSANDGSGLSQWFIGDLHEFRLWFHRETVRIGSIPGKRKENSDGKTSFRAFTVGHIPGFVVAPERLAVPVLRQSCMF